MTAVIASTTTAPVAPKIVTDSSYQWTVDPQVTLTITTSGNVNASGAVVIELQPQQAPITVANMLAYVNSGFYTDVIFHRAIQNFMIQAGWVGVTGTAGYFKSPIYNPITLESNNGLSNLTGTIAMARTVDPNSASAQFFINQVDNTFLNYVNAANPGYAVFGKVLTGMNVVNSIAQVPTNSMQGILQNFPNTFVDINSINQTVAGSAISHSTTLSLSDIAAGATWSYSLDSGSTWLAGVGSSIILPTGNYAVNQIEVKQTTAGVDSNISNFTSALEVDPLALAAINFSTLTSTVAVSDTSTIIANNLNTLQTNSALITSITETDSIPTAITLTATQYTSAISAKFTNFSAVVTDLTATAAVSAQADTNVSGFTVTDTSANISHNLIALLADTKLTSITQTDTMTALVISASQSVTEAITLTKIIGPYNLIITGIAGNDTLLGSMGNDTLNGGAGNDTLKGGAGNDVMTGGTGNDTLNGDAGNDTLIGGGGNDVMTGGTGNDLYSVDSLGDVVIETSTILTEIDTVNSAIAYTLGANVENLNLVGTTNINGTGNGLANIITGNAGNNYLAGGAGNDKLNGGAGNDTLIGGAGNDIIMGGAGNDIIYGGMGNDTLTGGVGADSFVFNIAANASTNLDTITDFTSGTDLLKFTVAALTSLGTLGQFAIGDQRFWSSNTGVAHDTTDRLIYNTSTGRLSYDSDGTGTGVAITIEVLGTSTHPALVATDIFVM